MNKEIKDKIMESLIEILPPLTNAVNDMINAAKGSKSTGELFQQVKEIHIQRVKFLKIVSEDQLTRKDLEEQFDQNDLFIFDTWLYALDELGKSIEIFLYLIAKDYKPGSEEKSPNFEEVIAKDGKQYTINDAVDYLFNASRQIANIIDNLYK
ncbi:MULTISPECIES: hypothetical protein [Bacillus]|uniref:hypothetical protein n=1 Tax=Bacillus TaxID=1386 RepID=UPI000BA5821F|nr:MULTISPECIES: hypothetical protein [Bacillus]MCQ5302411.1 hypothetical protein [Bacillus licheniformis]MCY8341114.1 hypothetical protein [Bacillus haynesii]MCY8641298.1 hypothetical protein [Bacillus haynesii]MEC0776482.1 hypothetical protein [Bacillus licheniformis]PAE61075.1 hypothetical protein CHH90_20950 [Bacillus licheniformis]